jgi:hypothetical protein
MQLEKASHPLPCAAGVPDDPPHAAAVKAKPAAVTVAAAIRTLVGPVNGFMLSMVAGPGNTPTSGR